MSPEAPSTPSLSWRTEEEGPPLQKTPRRPPGPSQVTGVPYPREAAPESLGARPSLTAAQLSPALSQQLSGAKRLSCPCPSPSPCPFQQIPLPTLGLEMLGSRGLLSSASASPHLPKTDWGINRGPRLPGPRTAPTRRRRAPLGAKTAPPRLGGRCPWC